MERPNNVGDREDQSNSNGNEEIQLSSTGNQRNPLDTSWTTKAKYGRDAAVLRSRRAKGFTHSGSFSNMSKVARNALVGWESHGSRIIKASFKTKKEGILMNIIQCYAPKNDSNDDIEDQFYERLQSVIEKCPRKDLTILMGDLNAKVGIDNTGYEDIMGRHGLGERNENGERFANLCAFNRLVIGSTIFPHKRIHKATWISPDHTTENQIDHICINKKFRRTMEDVRTRRGADIASDHHLVVANLKLKLKKNWTSEQTALQRFNTAVLRDTDKLNEFKIALNNRFQALQDLLKEEETSMEDNWKGIKEALTSTCQEVLGLKKHHHKEWISIETLDKIKERKNKKAAINNSRTRSEKDLTILMGDLNAKVGIDNTGYEDIMGRHGLGERNENGERFANLCAFNRLVIGGTIFPHKRIHKATWISPDHTTENQIDHICINKKFRRTMEDVRTRRGADIASDHHLVVANLKLKLKKNWTSEQTALQRFNTAVLRDTDKLNEFKIALNNRF
ncbi:unnamed protein product [Schistosoma margrebowiei]|uniref:Uncharacterized protein n=1 Tax=Schistosoma margrebowiei TaxID=48269 RepID=A0A183NB44_9TREM|nr:unnamed protein product [Schistosoma margrebowiei]